jgi:hypothetical protein
MKILEADPVPVVPIALHNLYGSYFSRIENGKAMAKPFRRGFLNRVALVAGPPVAPDKVTPQGLHDEVARLLTEPVRH